MNRILAQIQCKDDVDYIYYSVEYEKGRGGLILRNNRNFEGEANKFDSSI